MALLDDLLEPPNLNANPAIIWGKQNEAKAIKLYEKQCNVVVQPSGLFKSLEFGLIGASPDGLVGEDGIVEVKCPHKERFTKPTDVILRKSYALRLGKSSTPAQPIYEFSKTSHYYVQVVTQLHITGRKWCDFIIWTQGPLEETTGKPINPDREMHVTRVYRSDETLQKWNAIRDKLKKFYLEDYAPEIVDSMFHRNMGYRQPTYRLEAYRLAQKNKTDKLINTITTAQIPGRSHASTTEDTINPTTGEPPKKKQTRRRKSVPTTME